MYICMVITYRRVRVNRVRLPILLVVSGRKCDDKWLQGVRGGGGWGNRVGCSGELRRTGCPRVELVPGHGGCYSTRCLGGVQLPRWRRYPGHRFVGKRVKRASSVPIGGWGPASRGARHENPMGSWSLGGSSAEAVTSKPGPSKEGAGPADAANPLRAAVR